MPFIELPTVDSTNNYALRQLHEGLAHHGTAYFAHEQVSGKGQRGKSWVSEMDASLILSIVFNPQPLKLRQQFQLSACVAISVCEFFRKYAGEATRIKWPNDLYWHDRKAGGILIENIIGTRRPKETGYVLSVSGGLAGNNQQATNWLWAVAGVGININQTIFPEELKNPVSLKQITGKHFNPVELAKDLCFFINKNYNHLITSGFKDIYASYLSHLYKLNETVKLKKDNRIFEAVIKSISPEGELIVQHAVEEEFGFGEIEWLIPAGTPEK